MAISKTRLLLAFGAISLAQPVMAKRTVDYAVDDATVSSWSAEQGIPISNWPSRNDHKIALNVSSDVDHDVISAGVYCSAWSLRNPISQIIKTGFEHWGAVEINPDGAAGDATLRVSNAATLLRCVGTGELKAVCLSRVSIDAILTGNGSASPRPIHIVVEKAAKAIGACAGLTRGVALVSREAVIQLIASVEPSTVAH